MSNEIDSYVPLARLILGDGFRGTSRARWVQPLAQLLEATGRGQGQLPLAACGLDESAPPEFFTVVDGKALLPRNAALWHEIHERTQWLHDAPAQRHSDVLVRDSIDFTLPPLREMTVDGHVIFDNADQRLAVAAFVDARIGVITGGPGTGKTTTVAAILAIRKRLEPELRAEDVLLCAPTGKAACRLADSVNSAAERLNLAAPEREFLRVLTPNTIHRALEWSPIPPESGGPFRRNARSPLDQKLVIVDEASMLDLGLMTQLLRALASETSLLLLGDADQLESVETGGVLAELVASSSSVEPSSDQSMRWSQRLGHGAARPSEPNASASKSVKSLSGLVTRLRFSYRAKNAPWILELCGIARPDSTGDAEAFLSCCGRWHPNIRLHDRRRDLYSLCHERWNEAHTITEQWTATNPPSSSQLYDHLRRFQLLCADNSQVDRANRLGIAALWGSRNVRAGVALPHGCPILVTQNWPSLGISNGDVGMALGAQPGESAQVVFFPGRSDGIPVTQLPGHQPAFALTIHKSQGSEWNEVAIDIPDESELLDRNLLYTAISRSRDALNLYLRDGETLAKALGNRH